MQNLQENTCAKKDSAHVFSVDFAKFLRTYYKTQVQSCFDYVRWPICLPYQGALGFLETLITESARIPYNFKAIYQIVRGKTWESSDNFEKEFSFFFKRSLSKICSNMGFQSAVFSCIRTMLYILPLYGKIRVRKRLFLHILRNVFCKIIRNNFFPKPLEAATGDIL